MNVCSFISSLSLLQRLRMRIKAMQQVVDSQASRIAALVAEKEVAALGHQDEYTGQGKANSVHVLALYPDSPMVFRNTGEGGFLIV